MSETKKSAGLSHPTSGIRKIAQTAGVSTATVSRVLNHSSKVSIETRDRVLKVLEQSDFRLNAAAKALSTRRTKTIAAVIPTLEHSIFAVFLNAMEDQLAQDGYGLVIATHGFNKESETHRCNEALRLGAEAIVLSGADHDASWLNTLQNSGVPVLFTSVYKPDGAYPSYGYDNYALGSEAIDYLAKLGHKRIKAIHGPLDYNDRMRLRIAGLQSAGIRAGISVTLEEVSLSVAGGCNAVRSWLEHSDIPDACLCLADVLALGVIFEANKHQIDIPNQLSVMGFEDLDWAACCTPSLTTIALPTSEMGRAAAKALINKLDNDIDIDHRLFSAKLIERDSTGPSTRLKTS